MAPRGTSRAGHAWMDRSHGPLPGAGRGPGPAYIAVFAFGGADDESMSSVIMNPLVPLNS